jgi:hypothetical protein
MDYRSLGPAVADEGVELGHEVHHGHHLSVVARLTHSQGDVVGFW